MSRLTFSQPNGADVTIDIWGESMSSYSDEDFRKDPELRGIMKANVYVSFGWGSYHSPYEYHDRTFYWDDKGVYTYKKQKQPIFYWKVQNIEEEYDNWTKDKKGYHIPLNEPRKLKKNVF